MTWNPVPLDDPRMHAAIEELKTMVLAHYPGTTFRVASAEDGEGLELTAVVDIDDPDAVMDLVIERLLTLLTEDQVPLHFVPIRTPERARKLLQEEAARPHLPVGHTWGRP